MKKNEFIKYYNFLSKSLSNFSPIDREDLISAALMAVVEAKKSFDPKKGVALGTWIDRIIHFRIKDESRRIDVLERKHRNRIKKGIDQEVEFRAIGEYDFVDEDCLPEKVINKIWLRQVCQKIFNNGLLTDDEKTLIRLYYFEDLPMTKVGEVLNCSEALISLRHGEIIKKLRRRLVGYN